MYKHLYDKFVKWFHDDKGQVYFYSDPHFADEEMKYLRQNYIGDDEQVASINKRIGKYDTIVILGDIGDIEFVKKIRGYKVLIKGNHDSGASNYVRRRLLYTPEMYAQLDEKTKAECTSAPNLAYGTIYMHDNHLFDEVYEGPLFISDKILLSHEPISYPYALNIHGHDHSNWSGGFGKKNVCAELINYTPISLKDIVSTGILKQIPDIHRAGR